MQLKVKKYKSTSKEFYSNLRAACEKRAQEIIEVNSYCDIIIEKYQELIKKR